MSWVQAMSGQLIWSCQGPSHKDCFVASTASSIEVPLDRRKHHVLAGELDQRMGGVELPGTTGWNSRFTLRCHVISSLSKDSFRCCWLRERVTFSFPLPS